MESFLNIVSFIAIGAMVLVVLYIFGYYFDTSGDGNIFVFFRKKKHQYDPKSAEKVETVLNKFARLRGYEVLGRTTIEFGGTTFTFDNIIIGFYGTIAFNICAHGGDIYGDVTSEKWVQIYKDKRYEFDSPIKTLNGSIKMLKDLYRTEGVKCGNTETMNVFTDDFVNIALARSLPVCHVKDLGKKLDASKYLADNGANIEAMKAALAKYTK